MNPAALNPGTAAPSAVPAASATPKALQALGFALACVGLPVAAGCAAAVGLGALASDRVPAVALGFLCAALAVALGTAFSVRARRNTHLDADPRLAGQRVQVLLAASFVAKLAVLGLGFAALTLAGLKFEFLLAFALAFAGAVVPLQLVTVMRLLKPVGGRLSAQKANVS